MEEQPDSRNPSRFPEDLLPDEPVAAAIAIGEDAKLKAVLEAIVYVRMSRFPRTDCGRGRAAARSCAAALEQLTADYERPERGLTIREVAGGFKMSTKAEHHEAVRRFVKN